MLAAVEAALRRCGHLHREGGPEPLDDLEVGPVAEAEDVGAVVRDVDEDVVGPRDDGVQQHAVAVAALAACADVDALLHQRLRAATCGALALPGPGQLEVDGVLRRELLGALDEGGRLVLVVRALGLRQQLADAVDEAVAHSCPTSTASSP